MAAEVAAEGNHQQTVLSRARGCPNAIEVARDLRHCTLHQLSCRTIIAQGRDGPLAGLLPDSVGGQPRVRPNFSSNSIDLSIPPDKYSPSICHDCPISSERKICRNGDCIRASRNLESSRTRELRKELPREPWGARAVSGNSSAAVSDDETKGRRRRTGNRTIWRWEALLKQVPQHFRGPYETEKGDHRRHPVGEWLLVQSRQK